MREETFGPVCSFIGYRSEEEALARMNASPYGLAASVWSDNIRQALRYSEAIEAKHRMGQYAYLPRPGGTVRRHEGLGHRARIRQRVYR